MSRPVISSVVRRLSRPHSSISAFSPSAAPPVNFAASFCDTASLRSSLRPLKKATRGIASQKLTPRYSVVFHNAIRQRYPFSSSAIRTNAKILQNPRVDEDGKELTIKISPRAAEVGFYLSFDIFIFQYVGL
ncbi:uncharacterized protein BO72DRAFT_21428 [Aspergillus fijiensis CBS 313.89]|uniref:Uncharacterized protein n=1 Tax=Aspergillus fijiensis CBS 313.89 TaxID=1448319 RepID=A0A8G1VTM2_9EURO|nr:uncharacterized protein BO72DRAFT_21428 [Aspergillus fijiensis CBS 313.89]RAK71236.1 hypothetical protein BO72DRAFT_21428 [Aspergillus fijiensis CBS 313.89]